MLSAIGLCVKSFITIDRETTDPSGIENLITRRRTTKRTTFGALGDPFPGLKQWKYHSILTVNVDSDIA